MDYLCKCTNCDIILIDKNPQIDSSELPVPLGTEELIWNETEFAYVCPNCETDGNLIDL